MFRVLTKVPATRFNRHKNGPSRLYKTVKYYSQKKDLCPPKQTKNTSGITYTIGALVFVSGATIAYSKYDPEFRNWLKSVAPFTDDVIRFVCQEDKSFLDYFKGESEVSDVKDTPKVIKKGKAIPQEPTDYTAPKPVLPKLAEANKVQEDYTEIRLEKKVEGAQEPIVQIVGEVKPSVSELPLDVISRLETKIMEDATNAVQQFKKSINAVRNYNSDIEVLVDDSTENLDRSFWDEIQKKGSDKEAAIQTAEKAAKEALQNITKLKKMLTDEGSKIPEGAKERTRHNLQTIQNDIQQAKRDLEKEIKTSTLAEKYWKKVKEARTFFGEELQALFPNVDISQKELGIKSSDLDLFVMHAMSKVLYYQKELSKLETISANRLNAALETAAKDGNCEPLTHEQICHQLEKEKRALEAEYKNKCLQLRNKTESELRNQLKRQSEAFSDHMEDAVRMRELELERTLNRKFDEQLTDERCRYKMEVSAMVGRLRGLEEAMKVRSETDKTAKNAQVLWSACQALFKAVKSACPGFTGPDNIRPLKPEITAIKTAAADHDELVNVVLAGIPDEAKERGVFPEDALKERFNNVEKIAKRLALLSEKGGGLHAYLLSMLQSFLLLNATNPISQAELNDEQVDFSKLSTNEILQRARYWLDKGDFAQTLRYMNLLKGAPRAVARQWMNETRILLETQQAANTLMAYAAAASLL